MKSKKIDQRTTTNEPFYLYRNEDPGRAHIHTCTYKQAILLLSEGVNIARVVVTEVAISDHSCVFFESSICANSKSEGNNN